MDNFQSTDSYKYMSTEAWNTAFEFEWFWSDVEFNPVKCLHSGFVCNLSFCRCPLPEKEALMFIWSGENIDQYFCNEEMAFANRSYPVPDVGTCLAFKSLKPPSAWNWTFTLAFGKSFLIGARPIRKRDWLLVLLCDLHLHLKVVGQPNPPCKCNFQRNPSLFAFTWKTSLFAFIWKISLFAFIWKTVRALLLLWLKCRAGQANPSRDCVPTANLARGLQDMNRALLFEMLNFIFYLSCAPEKYIWEIQQAKKSKISPKNSKISPKNPKNSPKNPKNSTKIQVFRIFETFSDLFGCFDTSGSLIPLLVPEISPSDFFVTSAEESRPAGGITYSSRFIGLFARIWTASGFLK